MLRPSPLPLPTSLVVKKGSITFSRCSARNAGAVVGDGQAHEIARGSPAARSATACRFSAEMVTVPPSGIASRALMIRLTSASSSCAWSAKASHTSLLDLPLDLDQPAERVGQQVRDRLLQRTRGRSGAAPASGGGRRRAAAGRARCPARPRAWSCRGCAAARRRGWRARSIRLKPPMTAASRLLKSCAMPPVSLPIASIFCAWISWLSSERCSLMSVSVPANSTGRPVAILQQHGLIEEMLVAAVGALPAIFDRRAAALAPRLERSDHPIWSSG